MKNPFKYLICIWLALPIFCMAFTGDVSGWARGVASARISLLLATGQPGSVDYQVGLGLASLWTTRLKSLGIRVSAAITEGARENIEAVRIGDADLIIADEYFSQGAITGAGPFKDRPLPQLRAITLLWPELLHLIIRAEKFNTGSIQDLESQTVGVGLPDSSVKHILEIILKENLGAKRDIKIKPMSNLGLIEAWKSGSLNAMSFSGGLPLPIVNHFAQQNKGLFRFLSISEADISALNSEALSNMTGMMIPPGTYVGQDHEIRTLGQHNILLTSSALDAQVVYELTKTMFSNLDYLLRIHPACGHLSLEKALSGLKIPLHRGALKFFREKNLPIPEELVSD